MCVIMVTAAALFVVMEILNLDPFVEEILLATGFFVCIFAIARFYFWPKLWLMLQGADLDKNFQIVFPVKKDKVHAGIDEDNITASARAANASTAATGTGTAVVNAISDKDAEVLKKYLTKMPKTMDECRILMEHLAQRNMVLLTKILILTAQPTNQHSQNRKQPLSLP